VSEAEESQKNIIRNDIMKEFEVVIAIPEKKEELVIGLPREKIQQLIEIIDSLKWDKKTLIRYINYAIRLRKLEKEYGKSYHSLLREYEKLTKEEVKTRYMIQQLQEKRKRIEEDLSIYMSQYNLTLESVKKISSLLEALREHGLRLEELEKIVRVLQEFRQNNYDVDKIISIISKYEDLSKKMDELNREVSKAEEELRRLQLEKNSLQEIVQKTYGHIKNLEELEEAVKRLSEERSNLFQEISKYREDVDSLRREIEELTKMKFDISEVNKFLEKKRSELSSIEAEIGELKKTLSKLLQVSESIEEIIAKHEELSQNLRKLQNQIEEKEKYLELLENEMAAAYSILRLLQDPEGGTVEDLETLAQYIQKLIKIKRGEAIAQKSLEPYFLEKTRRLIVDLIMPYVKKDFVPKWVFERIERELKNLNEKRVMLEEEVASLRRVLEEKSRGTGPTPAPSLEVKPSETRVELQAIASDGSLRELETIGKGRKARITCIHCKQSTVVALPSEEELEKLSSGNFKLRFKCSGCSKTYDVSPDSILKRIRGE